MHATFQTFLPSSRGYSRQLVDNAMLTPNKDARPSIFSIGVSNSFLFCVTSLSSTPHQPTRSPRQRNLMQINVLTEHSGMAPGSITKCVAKTCCQSMVLPQNTQPRPHFCPQLHTCLGTHKTLFSSEYSRSAGFHCSLSRLPGPLNTHGSYISHHRRKGKEASVRESQIVCI